MTSDPLALERWRIRELIERYSYAVNTRDWPVLADCFTENGVWDVGAPFNFKTQGRAATSQLISEKISEFEFVIQMPHASMIWLEGDRARAHTTMQELVSGKGGTNGIQMLGTYTDNIVRDGGTWRFELREFRVVNVLMEAPPATAFT